MTERRRRQLEKHIAGLEKARGQWATVLDAYQREGRAERAADAERRLYEIDGLLERARRELQSMDPQEPAKPRFIGAGALEEPPHDTGRQAGETRYEPRS